MGCIEAMLWLCGEPLRPYWGGMGVNVWVLPRGLGAPGHEVRVVPRALGVPVFYHTDWGVLWTKHLRAPGRRGHLAS
jgi:hypothetical protein